MIRPVHMELRSGSVI